MNSVLSLHTLNVEPLGLRPVDAVTLMLRELIDYALEGKGGGFRLKLANETKWACLSDFHAVLVGKETALLRALQVA